jgi:hypothetical protein
MIAEDATILVPLKLGESVSDGGVFYPEGGEGQGWDDEKSDTMPPKFFV